MDHVICTGCRMLKLASNFEMFIYFFVFCRIEKKDELLCNFCNEITQLFLDLEGAPKCISQQDLKNNNNDNNLIFNANFNIRRPVQMT